MSDNREVADIQFAPSVQYVNGKFILYYAASSFGSQKSGIFQAQVRSTLLLLRIRAPDLSFIACCSLRRACLVPGPTQG
jgi:hypothetical protein